MLNKCQLQELVSSQVFNKKRFVKISNNEFNMGDNVLLKVSPWKKVIRFQKRGKLGSRFIRPFKVIARVGKVTYQLEFPLELSQIHNTFHVSQLRSCLADESAHIPINDM
ncbi:hypothetical protein OSB04_016693 [Centaurea solstitialis]|uniref:Tf2-1-like SH3-like domain-containing protein n=1 Tax=Centaurea solstitialis TaxID=347529 RepID=A0AA38T946_9ASTR|nr:hypothetical protein OSB04_016693 [Centaurea solstitialis]